jgi:hypothetical protein
MTGGYSRLRPLGQWESKNTHFQFFEQGNVGLVHSTVGS